jgi:hypothetical protein
MDGWFAPLSQPTLTPSPASRTITYTTSHACTQRDWPYEHIVPGIPKNDLPYRDGRQKGHKREVERRDRQARIKEYRVSRQADRPAAAAAGWLLTLCMSGCTAAAAVAVAAGLAEPSHEREAIHAH